MALGGAGGGFCVGEGMATKEEVDLVDGLVHVRFDHFLRNCPLLGHAGGLGRVAEVGAVKFACRRVFVPYVQSMPRSALRGYVI